MRRVTWTDEAIESVDAVWKYVRAFNAPAATRLVLRLYSIAETLSDNPERGRLLRDDVRQLTTASPYLMRYRVTPETIYILNIRHGSRREN